jgi:hypothetical protein
MGSSDRKMDRKPAPKIDRSKTALDWAVPLHDNINISQRDVDRHPAALGGCALREGRRYYEHYRIAAPPALWSNEPTNRKGLEPPVPGVPFREMRVATQHNARPPGRIPGPEIRVSRPVFV